LSATALVALFPELEPLLGPWRRRYTGAQGGDELLAATERQLEQQLPVKSRVQRAWLVEDTAGGWRRHTAFPLERRTSV
jgi:hypothetical protein